MTRTYGRSERGKRLVARVPYGRWETTTFLGAMRSTGFVAPLCVEGAINRDVFRAWVQQHLVHSLHAGDVVVMDNLSSHKTPDVVAAIEAVGAHVRYLPPTHPISIQSNWRSASSKSCSATGPSGPTKNSGISADASSTYSPKAIAEITYDTADTATLKGRRH